jgi:hypothetical protein
MKINSTKLAQLIREELEVILTDPEANEMFGLESMLQEDEDWVSPRYGGGRECKPDGRGTSHIQKAANCTKRCREAGLEAQRDGTPFDWLECCRGCNPPKSKVTYASKPFHGDWLEEDNKIFAPNHYCVHHGAVQNEGVYVAAKAVNHNFNEELGRVTHYDMQLADGTVLENIAAEDILVTEASLANEHQAHMVAKRDDEEDTDVNDGTTDDDKDKVKTSYGHAVKEEQEEDRLEEYGSGCRGECAGKDDAYGCEERCKERKRAEKARADAKLDKRIGTGSWGEGKVAMSRKDLADMIREEMARVISRDA